MTTQGAEENSEQKPLLLTTLEIGEGTAGRSTNGTLRRHKEYLWIKGFLYVPIPSLALGRSQMPKPHPRLFPSLRVDCYCWLLSGEACGGRRVSVSSRSVSLKQVLSA